MPRGVAVADLISKTRLARFDRKAQTLLETDCIQSAQECSEDISVADLTPLVRYWHKLEPKVAVIQV